MSKTVTHKSNWGFKYTITATDASNGYAQFSMGSYDIVPNIMCVNASGSVVAITGAVITFPATGTVRIASGGSYTITATDVLYVLGHANSENYS